MLTKDGDSETKERLRVEEATEDLGEAALLSRNIIEKKWAKVGLLSPHWRIREKSSMFSFKENFIEKPCSY